MQESTVIMDGEYVITDNKDLMKVEDIHSWLSEKSYWNKGVSFDTVQTAFANSYCIGVRFKEKQIGYARLITDHAIFGYLADVFIEEEHRGKGLSKAMLRLLLNNEWVKNLRSIKLATTDGHGLYAQFGFTACRYPERIMELTK